jgi:hypothetical protein
MLSEWALMKTKDGIALNYLGPAQYKLRSGVTLKVVSNYPISGDVKIHVEAKNPAAFELKVRIPQWVQKARYKINEEPSIACSHGKYLTINRTWSNGDSVELDLSVNTWLMPGERECQGKVSIYHGPILLAFDPRFNPGLSLDVPRIDIARTAQSNGSEWRHPVPFYTQTFFTKDGKPITLCDFATAGMAGNRYLTWLPHEPYTALPPAISKAPLSP